MGIGHLDILDLKRLNVQVVHPDERQSVLQLKTCITASKYYKIRFMMIRRIVEAGKPWPAVAA